LQAGLSKWGLQVQAEDNGQLAVFGGNLQFMARPGLISTLAPLSSAIGVYLLPSNLPNVSNVLQVFRDETGTKRQQWLYPAPKGRFLTNLFQKMPGTQSVSLNNDGTILVAQENSKKIHGLLGYQWKAGGTPTGSMQFAQGADMNGDGLSDYLITYENGETQVMYRLP